jgi:hypothetical protein
MKQAVIATERKARRIFFEKIIFKTFQNKLWFFPFFFGSSIFSQKVLFGNGLLTSLKTSFEYLKVAETVLIPILPKRERNHTKNNRGMSGLKIRLFLLKISIK